MMSQVKMKGCYCSFISNKKAFQLKANSPLADRCTGYIVNKFEQVGGGDRGQTDKHDWKFYFFAISLVGGNKLEEHPRNSPSRNNKD